MVGGGAIRYVACEERLRPARLSARLGAVRSLLLKLPVARRGQHHVAVARGRPDGARRARSSLAENDDGSPQARPKRVRRSGLGAIRLRWGRLDLAAAGVPATLIALVIAAAILARLI